MPEFDDGRINESVSPLAMFCDELVVTENVRTEAVLTVVGIGVAMTVLN